MRCGPAVPSDLVDGVWACSAALDVIDSRTGPARFDARPLGLGLHRVLRLRGVS